MAYLTMHFPDRPDPTEDEVNMRWLPRPGDEMKYDGRVYVVSKLRWDVDRQALSIFCSELD